MTTKHDYSSMVDSTANLEYNSSMAPNPHSESTIITTLNITTESAGTMISNITSEITSMMAETDSVSTMASTPNTVCDNSKMYLVIGIAIGMGATAAVLVSFAAYVKKRIKKTLGNA